MEDTLLVLDNLTVEELMRVTGYVKKLQDSGGYVSVLTREESGELSYILTKYLLKIDIHLN